MQSVRSGEVEAMEILLLVGVISVKVPKRISDGARIIV